MTGDAVGLLQEILTHFEEAEDIYPDHIGRLLRDAAGALFKYASSIKSGEHSGLCESQKTTESALDSLLALADENINNTDFYLVEDKWLSLYTDSSLLRAMSDVTTCIKGTEKAVEQSMDAIRLLDMAMIVAGATTPNRMDWVQRAIALVQSIRENEISYQDTTPATLSRPAKRTKVHDPAVLSFAPTSVPVLAIPPSLENYLVHHREKPFILPGYLSTANDYCPPWPAISKWADPDYLLSRVGRGRWVPVEEGSAYDDKSWGQRIVPFEDFLRRAGFAQGGIDSHSIESRPMYLAQHSLFRQFPDLERDIVIPDYAWSNPAAPMDSPNYRPPSNEDGLIVNVWIGSGSGEIVSPAHTDPYYNCYAQVLGHKRVWLAPPRCSPYMECHGSTVTDDKDDLSSKYMGNTSRLPLLRPGSDLDTMSSKFPSFKEHVWPCCMEAVLHPGDLLVMPPGWWHAMRGEGQGPGWSVSMWY